MMVGAPKSKSGSEGSTTPVADSNVEASFMFPGWKQSLMLDHIRICGIYHWAKNKYAYYNSKQGPGQCRMRFLVLLAIPIGFPCIPLC
ncbi:uncharacterized protein IAS62_003763 [Cryptococcus decagattii]|uniref:Uncharacterized protein n=1 Tax=Cryptococcus decagattii TaxID=1859122 RepID=A0ABZ2AV75_9TREE